MRLTALFQCAILRTMSVSEDIKAIEARADELGIEMKAVLAHAGVHRATWDRWKSGAFEPQMKKWRKVQEALDALQNSRAA